VQLEADDFPRYRATLEDATDRTVWRSAPLQRGSTTGTPTVVVTLPAAMLEPRVYTLELSGISTRGDEEPAGSYPFRVVLR
jgi:hypothetical protein